MTETFISRDELRPHLTEAQIVWTRGGKLSAQDQRVGHLSSGEKDGIKVDSEIPRLNGELKIFESTQHLEGYVRDSFNQAFEKVLRNRAAAEERRSRPDADDLSLTSELRALSGALKTTFSRFFDRRN